MSDDVIAQAADRLRAAHRTRVGCAPVRELIGDDLDAAYAVQESLTTVLLPDGDRVVGHRIGLTSAAEQRRLGASQPVFGTLTASTAYADGMPVPLGRFLQPRVGAEVAFVLGHDLDIERCTVADVLRATDFLLPAVQITDSRIAEWDITVTDTVADNGSSGAFVLGTTPVKPDEVVLPDIGTVLEHQGEVVSTGAGAACLGSPVTAVAWLAGELSRRGKPLRAGHVVLSGAIGPVVPVRGAGVYRARLESLGAVRAVFEGQPT